MRDYYICKRSPIKYFLKKSPLKFPKNSMNFIISKNLNINDDNNNNIDLMYFDNQIISSHVFMYNI